MAKKRRFSAYRQLDTPFTRTSRFRKKSYIRMTKNPRIVRWHMGDKDGDYDVVYSLVSKQGLQIRDNAIESCRQIVNRICEGEIGKMAYHLHIRIYPHHILREHSLASGAGADRMSTGMARPFGKPVGVAAQIREGQVLMEIFCKKQHADIAKKAFSKGKTKLPGSYLIEIEKVGKKE